MTAIPAGFLSAILAAPDDDTPRLVLADWIDEQGEAARAEFIRLQIRIAALEEFCGCGRCVKRRGGGQHTNGPCAVDQERDTLPDGRSRQAFLRMRERELFRDSGPKWWNDLPGAYRATVEASLSIETACGVKYAVRRGFVEAIVCSWPDCRDRLDAIRRAQPVTRVTLTSDPEVEQVAQRESSTVIRLAGRQHRTAIPIEEIARETWQQMRERYTQRLLAMEWPGITFTLPE